MIGQTKKINVLTLAPDALVFINGIDTINVCPLCNCGIKIKDVLTSISVDLSVDSAPGSATLSIANPQHLSSPLLDAINNAFSPMQEVEIYMKSRLTKQGKYSYYPVFWGFISSVSDNYGDGNYNISINCKDILRWWEISRINVKPGSLDTTAIPSIHPVIWAKTFSNKPIPQIIRDLAKITVSELLPVQNLFESTNSDKIQVWEKGNEELLDYWNERFSQVGRSLKIFGFNNVEFTNDNVATLKERNVTKTETRDPTRKTDDQDERRQGAKGVVTDDNAVSSLIGFNVDGVKKVIPETLTIDSINLFAAEPMSKLDIANEVKEVIKFEFYMDVNGEIIFKPPFYNMDVSDNPIHVIEGIDISDWGFTEDESGIVTRVDVTGSYGDYNKAEDTKNPIWGNYIDYFRSKQFGIRSRKFSVPFLRTKEECEVYAHSELNRLNALLKTGSITIAGRPELRLGYPVYVKPKDAFYYVTGISHNFSFGSSFTTSLTLTAERKRLYKEDGVTILKNRALLLEDPPRENEVDALSYAIALRQENPEINDGELKTKINQTYELTDVIVSKIVNTSKPPSTLQTQTSSKSPLSRIYDPCINQPIQKSRLSTIDEIDTAGNQGKISRFIEKKLTITTLADLRNNIQITDENGYLLIGSLPYGRYSKIPQSTIASRTLTEIENMEDNPAKRLAFMLPDSQRKNKEIDKDNQQITYDDIDKMMISVKDPGSASFQSKNMRIMSEEDECNCTCHFKRR